jgi:hypothetical protein
VELYLHTHTHPYVHETTLPVPFILILNSELRHFLLPVTMPQNVMLCWNCNRVSSMAGLSTLKLLSEFHDSIVAMMILLDVSSLQVIYG